ncbi:hypothetical protein GCM10010234_40390 [Streptomyces hawaiiensis]
MQVVQVLNGDVKEEVVASREHEDVEDFRQATGEALEGVDDDAAERAYLNRHQRLNAAVEGRGIDVGVIAADDAPAVERPNPFQAGGGGDAELPGELAIGLPCICLEKPDDLRIKFIHGPLSNPAFSQMFGWTDDS